MAASQRPVQRMESRCTPATARATLAFQIVGYSLHKGLGAGKFIRSPAVAVGGYEWCIRYYPDGDIGEDNKDYVSVYVELLSKRAEVKALCDVRLVNQATSRPPSSVSCFTWQRVLNSIDGSKNEFTWGAPKFKKRRELEKSTYLRDDRLVIECDLTVINEPLVADTGVEVPPSDLSDNLGKLLETEEGADVSFKVKGEVFPAHKIVLAMRSPVFKAEFYGPMRDETRRNITVEDMQPAVFKALLHFIYKDSLPSMDGLEDDDNEEMVKHLMVAADRYAMERMKMICEDILCKSLDVKTVATTFALADQHHCNRLKDACVEFITSSNRMDDVVASQGYVQLKRSCPAVLVDMLEKLTNSRKI